MSGKHGACVENDDDDNEEFTIIDDHFKCESEEEINELFKEQDKGLDEVIDQIDDLKLDLSQDDIAEVVTELRHLEEKLHLWREVRQATIAELGDIADYIDKVAKQTGIAKVGNTPITLAESLNTKSEMNQTSQSLLFVCRLWVLGAGCWRAGSPWLAA